MDADICLKIIETYYQLRCDGTWEHFNGFNLESCDNPGWLITLKDNWLIKLNSLSYYKQVANSIASLNKAVEFQISHIIGEDNDEIIEIRIFSNNLYYVVDSMAQFLNEAIDIKL